jgi:hypothetical protein
MPTPATADQAAMACGRGDQHAGAGRERRCDAAEREDREAAEQREPPAVAVSERPGRDEECREAQGVGVRYPLQ